MSTAVVVRDFCVAELSGPEAIPVHRDSAVTIRRTVAVISILCTSSPAARGCTTCKLSMIIFCLLSQSTGGDGMDDQGVLRYLRSLDAGAITLPRVLDSKAGYFQGFDAWPSGSVW